mmetsp:Transcript_19448/g.45570  ORF Transcript_19448/g.45570 Transcript_19448/m.45570 type:complete len:308 (+) Transcript_19448:2077-3000(+)
MSQLLGRDVKQLNPAVRRKLIQLLDDELLLVLVALRGVQKDGLNTRPHHRLDLILHQREKGGDDDRQAGLAPRGKLIAERLTPASGQEDEHVATAHCILDHLLLARTEPVVTEHSFQLRKDILGLTHMLTLGVARDATVLVVTVRVAPIVLIAVVAVAAASTVTTVARGRVAVIVVTILTFPTTAVVVESPSIIAISTGMIVVATVTDFVGLIVVTRSVRLVIVGVRLVIVGRVVRIAVRATIHFILILIPSASITLSTTTTTTIKVTPAVPSVHVIISAIYRFQRTTTGRRLRGRGLATVDGFLQV